MSELERLKEDIQTLWNRGYISREALSPIPAGRAGVDDPEPVITVEMLREVLRRAGFSDKQIDERDYISQEIDARTQAGASHQHHGRDECMRCGHRREQHDHRGCLAQVCETGFCRSFVCADCQT